MFYQCVILVFVLIFILDFLKPRKFVKLHKQLGCDTIYLPIIGNILRFAATNEGKMISFQKGAELAYKSKHGAISYWLGNSLFVEVSDFKQACFVLKNTVDKNYIHEAAKHLIGNGTVFAPGPEWHRRRKILDQIFVPRNVNKFINIFDSQIRRTLDQIDTKVTTRTNLSCWDYIFAYSFNTISETVLGIKNTDSQGKYSIMYVFFEYIEVELYRLFQPWLRFKLFKIFFTRQEKLKKIIHDYFNDVIHKKKISMEKNTQNFTEANTDNNDIKVFLELMIESSKDSDKGYTDEELLEEVLVLMMAGSDTNSITISFTMVMLSQHPDVQERVYQEILEVLGDLDRSIQFPDLQKLKYLEAVIKETMRLFPPVPLTLRHCSHDIELPSGLILPKDTAVVINIWGIHRNPDYWGADVTDFNPERFLSGRIPATSAFMPFSIGSRNCIGNHFAMLSVKTVLTNMLRRYRFLPATTYKYDKQNPLRTSFQLMAKHVNNYELQIERRRY